MNKFSNGMEYANFAVCSDLPLKALDAISKLPNSMDIDDPASSPVVSVTYAISQVSSKGPVIIAFGNSSPISRVKNHLQREESRSFIEAKSTGEFGFLCTKENPVPSINKATVDCFDSLLSDFPSLKNQIQAKIPLIITGHSLGGSIASLFTLWLLNSIYSKAKERPICITFGSPLVGDKAFQGAISERATWISCFLHLISNRDPIPKTFLTSNASPNYYMPFGRTIFLSDSGCACFEESESALKIIEAVNSSGCPCSGIIEYREIMEKLRSMAISGEDEMEGESDGSTLREGITLQIQAVTEETSNLNAIFTYIEERTGELFKRRRIAWENQHPKMLNNMRIFMAHIEWYKKLTIKDGGYYDHYKSDGEMEMKATIEGFREPLKRFWEEKVMEIERMPKREGDIRPRFKWGGMNYRRMFEPFDIANYYKEKGNRGYIEEGRSEHFKLLERWAKNDKLEERKKPSSMTEDSCFWARVEEAALSCKELKDGTVSQESATLDLIKFEEYVIKQIRNYAVSPEIFLEKSSFIRWWKAYMEIKGDSYESQLKTFMKKENLDYGSKVLKEYSNLS